ncbi:hypothetical protein GIB67_028389 [Kingdonia uniflora]|uniref:RING-type E3 ubiquitin transferase n=1 Tax=Kingdonia uniflora TaxID=39325 RepID=A0A7J7MI00_9MAGN|nr:hypothetical protein GIB67_028389 [Kingdonia uniflora]
MARKKTNATMVDNLAKLSSMFDELVEEVLGSRGFLTSPQKAMFGSMTNLLPIIGKFDVNLAKNDLDVDGHRDIGDNIIPLLLGTISGECGLRSSASSSCDESDACAVCLERECTVAAEGCGHELCARCALYLCSASNIPSGMVGPPGSIPCPLCRHGIISFVKLPSSTAKEFKLHLSLGFCTPCMLHTHGPDLSAATACIPEIRRNRVASVSSDMLCPVSCSPFPLSLPLCSCNDDPCSLEESQQRGTQEESPHLSQGTASLGQNIKLEGQRVERTTCSSMLWGRRSCHREHQCNSEINA